MARRLGVLFLAIKTVCAAIIFSCALWMVWAVGPALETKFNPVVSKLEILRTEPGEIEGTTNVYAAFRKLRECEYIGITWYKGSRDGEFERVPVILLRDPDDTSSPNRPVGYQKAGPGVIGMSEADLRTNSFAELKHSCWPFWVSTTWFYP